jgi:hypothetical protein
MARLAAFGTSRWIVASGIGLNLVILFCGEMRCYRRVAPSSAQEKISRFGPTTFSMNESKLADRR